MLDDLLADHVRGNHFIIYFREIFFESVDVLANLKVDLVRIFLSYKS